MKKTKIGNFTIIENKGFTYVLNKEALRKLKKNKKHEK